MKRTRAQRDENRNRFSANRREKSERRRRRKRAMKNSQQRIAYRLRDISWEAQERPMFQASNIHYEISERQRAIDAGGIGVIHLLAQKVGLVDAIDRRLHLLKFHLPYHESDHVLNIAYNAMCGGTCLEENELRRNDEGFLNALGAQRIPDPTTAGDFCRRFEDADVEVLMRAINECRLRVWKCQPESFFEEAVIDGDGTIAPTTGECKSGMDMSYKGDWGYHPLVISLANTQEELFLVNRSGSRPSHEGASERFDQAAELCKRGGFRRITFRGDTDFTQSRHLDRWDDSAYRFVFGFDAIPKLQALAMDLKDSAWKRLKRPAKWEVATEPRTRPTNVKEQIVRVRGYKNIRLDCEDVAEFEYQPGNCKRTYRMVVVRKNLTIERGEQAIIDDIRFFFYITNDRDSLREEIVFEANGRCNQENLIDQLKNGVRAMRMPVDNLVSNWAYMVMAALAWNLKAWAALLLPVRGRWEKKRSQDKDRVLRMEFKQFVNAFIRVPAQIVRSGRRIIYRLLSWNPFQHVFIRLLEQLDRPLRC